MYNYPKVLVRSGNLTCTSLKAVINAHNNLIPFELDSHELMLFEAQKEYKRLLHMKHAELFDYIYSRLDPIHHQALLRQRIMTYQCGYQYLRLKETTLILNRKSLGMHLPSVTINFC